MQRRYDAHTADLDEVADLRGLNVAGVSISDVDHPSPGGRAALSMGVPGVRCGASSRPSTASADPFQSHTARSWVCSTCPAGVGFRSTAWCPLNAGHRGEPKHLRLRELPGELDLPGSAAFGGGRLLPATAKLESVECSGTLVRAFGAFAQR